MHTSSMGTLRILNSVLSVNNVKLSLEMVWNRVVIENRDPAYFYLYIDSPNHPPSPHPKNESQYTKAIAVAMCWWLLSE